MSKKPANDSDNKPKATKTIVVPEPIEIDISSLRCNCGADLSQFLEAVKKDPDKALATGKVEATFSDYIVKSVLSDPEMVRKDENALDDIFLLNELLAAVKPLKPGDEFKIGKGEYQRILKIVKKPTNGYNTTLAPQLVPFFRAILDAK